jgi:hypothetical protein
MMGWLDASKKKSSPETQGRKEPLIEGENAETELTQRANIPTSTTTSQQVPLDAPVGDEAKLAVGTSDPRHLYGSPLSTQTSIPTQAPPRGRPPRNWNPSTEEATHRVNELYYVPGTAGREAEIPSKIPSEQFMPAIVKQVFAIMTSAGVLYSVTFGFMAFAMVYGVLRRAGLFTGIKWDQEYNVAFIGNSYLFVNDIPRLMEAVSEGHIYQDSCIHAGGSLSAILATGNGMYNRWATDEAIIYSEEDYTAYGGYRAVYDYGSCSIAQLLRGTDDTITYGNSNGTGTFYDDGSNPCLQDPYYLEFLTDTAPTKLKWDFVVLADQTKRMAISSARQDSIDALTNTYAPLLKKTKAVPIIVDTHAFWSDNSNMTGLTDVPTFTSLLYEGVQDYVDALTSALPSRQAPLVAPIGLAYLTIYEEDYELWQRLFLDDNIHASVHGSYLFACVLYCTLFGHLPSVTVDLPEYLFANARKLMGNPQYPNYEESVYLHDVARRVALHGYVPSSLKQR